VTFDDVLKDCPSNLVKLLADGSAQFHHFEVLYYQVQERVHNTLREKERALQEYHNIPSSSFLEVRCDLLDYNAMFQLLDEDLVGVLCFEKMVVVDFLASVGIEPIDLTKKSLMGWIREVKQQDRHNTEMISLDLTFKECLLVVQLVRAIDRAKRNDVLRAIFFRYDTSRCGMLPSKDLSRLLKDAECMPRTRQEQADIEVVLMDADPSGCQTITLHDFMAITQRIMFGINRRKRQEERDLAKKLGFPPARYRELTAYFREHTTKLKSELLDVADLREIMDKKAPRKITSEEMFLLFDQFGTPDGMMDLKGFFAMVSSIRSGMLKFMWGGKVSFLRRSFVAE